MRLPSPEPAAGRDAYDRERELRLASSPDCRLNYERYLATRGTPLPDYLPIKLDIENVSRCNLRCTMCVVSDWHKGRRAADLSLDSFKRLIDEQFGLVEIKLQGIGEPMLQRDDFFTMIEYARAQHIWVRVTTNATLMHVRDGWRRLIDSDINEIQISVDGATPQSYEAIRRGARFHHVMENISTINAYQHGRGVERTKMWTVVQKGNKDELPALVDLASKLLFTNQVFSLELSDWGVEPWRTTNSASSVSMATDDLLALVERGRGLGVRVAFWHVAAKYNREHLCPWPFERAYVSSDERVVPCCYVGNPDVAQIGPALDHGRGLGDIWRGKDYHDFRQAHIDGRLPTFCRSCYER